MHTPDKRVDVTASSRARARKASYASMLSDKMSPTLRQIQSFFSPEEINLIMLRSFPHMQATSYANVISKTSHERNVLFHPASTWKYQPKALFPEHPHNQSQIDKHSRKSSATPLILKQQSSIALRSKKPSLIITKAILSFKNDEHRCATEQRRVSNFSFFWVFFYNLLCFTLLSDCYRCFWRG